MFTNWRTWATLRTDLTADSCCWWLSCSCEDTRKSSATIRRWKQMTGWWTVPDRECEAKKETWRLHNQKMGANQPCQSFSHHPRTDLPLQFVARDLLLCSVAPQVRFEHFEVSTRAAHWQMKKNQSSYPARSAGPSTRDQTNTSDNTLCIENVWVGATLKLTFDLWLWLVSQV